MFPRPVSTGEAAQKLCTFCYRFNFIDMYISAAIINSGHNVYVQNLYILQASLLQKCLGREIKYTFLATALVILYFILWACHLRWSSKNTPR